MEARLCTNCDLDAVETELHFLFHCPKFDYQRQLYMEHFDINDSDPMEYLNSIFMDDNRTRQLAKYLNEAMQLRTA